MDLALSILHWCGFVLMNLRILAASLPDPDNCARCRADGAVCHPWHSAVRRHGLQARSLPWVALPDRFVIAPYSSHAHPLPDNATSVGSTNDWLALGLGQKHTTDDDDDDNDNDDDDELLEYYVVHNYVLHNPFSNRSLPLPELDAVIDDGRSLIRKFLMRSTVDDVIVVITNNWKHPLIVFQQGKGVWSPEPAAASFIDIIDIAFLGDKLYAITTAEDLIPLDLTWDGDGRPMVTMGTCVIEQSLHYDDYYDSSTTFDEEDHDDQNEEEEDGQEEDEEDNDEEEEEDNGFTYINFSAEYDQDVGPDVNIRTSRHLIESHGKLLMVKHRHQFREQPYPYALWNTLQVDVFEADFNTHAWVPLTGGLGGGRALFVSMNFSKSVPAPRGEVEEDAIYFMETENVYNMKSGTCSPSKFGAYSTGVTWLFPPE